MNIFTDEDVKKKIEVNDYEITVEDFKFVNEGKVIHDEKFATKPTTFFKDALKRFRKNKSSVVGAFILGFLLLLAIFVPMISSNEIDSPIVKEAYLAPKLFKSGTGFWDGTRKVKNVIYDKESECPADYYKPAVTKLKVDSEPTFINQKSKYCENGYINFSFDNASDTSMNYFKSNETTFTASGNYMLNVSFGQDENVNGNELAEYAIYLISSTGDEYLLSDWKNTYEDITNLNISQKLGEVTTKIKGSIEFRIKMNSDISPYLLIKEIELTSNDGNKDLARMSFANASEFINRVNEIVVLNQIILQIIGSQMGL